MCIMDCDVVYGLDAAGDTPRIVGASEMQSKLDALLAAGVADGTTSAAAHRKALRGRVVAETGSLVCSHGGTMVFRQRGVDGRKPHFAHLAVRSNSSEHAPGEASAPACACGGRGGRGHTHMQAQKLIVDHIASIEFKHWCPKKLHQVVVRKNAGFTAKVEQGARNASDRNVRLDVAVYKDGVFAFAVEVTHTHRVSAASREGIPYVDVNASETVRRLQSGETTLLCESASGVPQCVACLTEEVKVKLKNFKWLLRCAHWIWKGKVREAFDKLAFEKRAEKKRREEECRSMSIEDFVAHQLRLLQKWGHKAEAKWARQRKMRLQRAFSKLREVKRKQRHRECEGRLAMFKSFYKLEKEKREETRYEFEERLAMWEEDCLATMVRQENLKQPRNVKISNVEKLAREEEERRLEEQRESEAKKKKRTRTFWGAFMRHSGAAQSSAPKKTAASAAPKRQRVWETDRERAKRYREEHWEKMSRGEAATSNISSGSAPGFRRNRVCSSCKNARTILVKPSPSVNGGYGYVKQCNVCLQRVFGEGWGDGAAFSPEDDALICELLNANGEPMYEGYKPSRMHFYRSVLAFHDAFQHKKWEALVDHIRANFTTTMSAANAAMPGYRGWYRKDNNVAI